MDEQLEKQFEQLKTLVRIPDGENPFLNTADAFRMVEREQLVYRWEKRGETYYLRLSSSSRMPTVIHESKINQFLVDLVRTTKVGEAIQKKPVDKKGRSAKPQDIFPE